jgi:hypothetical protein
MGSETLAAEELRRQLAMTKQEAPPQSVGCEARKIPVQECFFLTFPFIELTRHNLKSSRKLAINYCNFAYSALACFSAGMSGSASFHSVKKSW